MNPLLLDVETRPERITNYALIEECNRGQFLSEEDKKRNKKALQWVMTIFAEGKGVVLPPSVYITKALDKAFVIEQIYVSQETGELLARFTLDPTADFTNISFVNLYCVQWRHGREVTRVFNDREEMEVNE